MSLPEKNETVSFTLRGLSSEIDKVITAVADTSFMSKNALIVQVLEREFRNHISTYAQSNMLVSAMDKELAKKFGIEILENWYESEYTIQYDRLLMLRLNLDSAEKVDAIFKSNINLIELRAQQLTKNGYMRLPRGISLTFALFIEIAKQDAAFIREIRKSLFGISKHYFEYINEIREAISLPAVNPIHETDS